MIKLNGIKKIYSSAKAEIHALNNIDLEIESGEIFGIIGYSGAGKSTLIRVINLLEQPTEGEIWIDGVRMDHLSNSDLRKARQKIGMIFQHFNLLWSRSVRDNIALPLEIAGIPKNERDLRVNELMEIVGLSDKADAYPSQLSGGQKQRVGIARALANKPKVLLSDEATSALDPKTTDSILKLLKEINRKLGITIILITHEMNVIQKICDKVAIIDNGDIAEVGPVLQVFAHPKKDITREFVQQATSKELDHDLTIDESVQSNSLYKLTFIGNTAKQPILSKWIKEFNVEANILEGNIKTVQDSAYGTLIIEMKGDSREILSSIDYLKKYGVEVEGIKSVRA